MNSRLAHSRVSNHAQRGFTLIEVVIGMVVSAVILGGVYKLFLTQNEQSLSQVKKIELRNAMTLSSKRIQRQITLAGMGLKGVPNLVKEDAVGSDTLIIFTNPNEAKTTLVSDVSKHQISFAVSDGSPFAQGGYIALISPTGGEIRRVIVKMGSQIYLDSGLVLDYSRVTAVVCPANRERFFSVQDSNKLVHEINGLIQPVASNIHDFQVSFRNQRGEATEAVNEIRTVNFSFTGVFPAKPGALNSVLLSSTAIPRNLL